MLQSLKARVPYILKHDCTIFDCGLVRVPDHLGADEVHSQYVHAVLSMICSGNATCAMSELFHRDIREEDVQKALQQVTKHGKMELNNRPLIGVLSQVMQAPEFDRDLRTCRCSDGDVLAAAR